MPKCKECNFGPIESVWESKSRITGLLGQKSPILADHKQTFPAYSPRFTSQQKIVHPLSFVTKETCRNCKEIILNAYESVYYKGKIIFEFIGTKDVQMRKRDVNHYSNPNHNGRERVRGKYRTTFMSPGGGLPLPVELISSGIAMGKTREKYNFHDESDEIKDAVFELVKKIFSVDGFLSEAQAKVMTKIKLGRKLRKSTERNTKRQLRNKFRSLEYIVDYWKDLEELL